MTVRRFALVATNLPAGTYAGDENRPVWDNTPVLVETESGQSWVLAKRADNKLEWTPISFAKTKAPLPPRG